MSDIPFYAIYLIGLGGGLSITFVVYFLCYAFRIIGSPSDDKYDIDYEN